MILLFSSFCSEKFSDNGWNHQVREIIFLEYYNKRIWEELKKLLMTTPIANRISTHSSNTLRRLRKLNQCLWKDFLTWPYDVVCLRQMKRWNYQAARWIQKHSKWRTMKIQCLILKKGTNYWFYRKSHPSWQTRCWTPRWRNAHRNARRATEAKKDSRLGMVIEKIWMIVEKVEVLPPSTTIIEKARTGN